LQVAGTGDQSLFCSLNSNRLTSRNPLPATRNQRAAFHRINVGRVIGMAIAKAD